MTSDQEILAVPAVHSRIRRIIPPEIDPRGFARRELAAKTVFVMLYGGAIEGEERWLRPTAVTDMTDDQARIADPAERRRWLDRAQGVPRPAVGADRWFGENTREPIRDETLRVLLEVGAVVERSDLPTTSPKPRYALARDFAALFAPALEGRKLEKAIGSWQERHCSREELARLSLTRRGLQPSVERPLVTLPGGITRRLSAGPSAELTKAVIESFALTFLRQPAVVTISESARKLTHADEDLARSIGLEIDVSRTLPDVILVDLAKPFLIAFVECVVSDGEIGARRKRELEDLARSGGFDPRRCAYVTTFADRARSRYGRLASSIAWGTFVWFASEPDHLVYLHSPGEQRLSSPLARFLRLDEED